MVGEKCRKKQHPDLPVQRVLIGGAEHNDALIDEGWEMFRVELGLEGS